MRHFLASLVDLMKIPRVETCRTRRELRMSDLFSGLLVRHTYWRERLNAPGIRKLPTLSRWSPDIITRKSEGVPKISRYISEIEHHISVFIDPGGKMQ